MRVKMRYLGSVGIALDKREEEIDISGTATLSDLLEKLAEKYGEKLKNEVLQPGRTDIGVGYMTMVNGVLISRLQDVQTKLKPGDTIVLMPTISGGLALKGVGLCM